MSKIARILELRYGAKLSIRAIARQLGLGRSTISRILVQAERSQITWPLPEQMTEAELQAQVYPSSGPPKREQKTPDWNVVHQELAQHRSLTLAVLWEEYNEQYPNGYSYPRYCQLYRQWRKSQVQPVMRHIHRAGDRLYIDYSGKKPFYLDPVTGQKHYVELFVAVLGASSYLYAEVTETQKVADFCGSVQRTFEFLGGVPRIIVPDNLKSAVIRFRKDDVPDLNESFRDLTNYYQVEVLPARPRKPRDKAKVESEVLHIQRRVLAVLRNQDFFSLAELNAAIQEQIHKINRAPFKKREGTRYGLFKELDRPALRPLPLLPYRYGQWTGPRKVYIDSHISVDNHHYSVPMEYIGKMVRALVRKSVVEIFYEDQRIASHVRSHKKGELTTNLAHMPSYYELYTDWSPKRLINWGRKIGTYTAQLIEANLRYFPIPEKGYRRCIAILKLADTYGHDVLEKASSLALGHQILTAPGVREFCERVRSELHQAKTMHIEHENIRGPSYYSSNESSEESSESSEEPNQ